MSGKEGFPLYSHRCIFLYNTIFYSPNSISFILSQIYLSSLWGNTCILIPFSRGSSQPRVWTQVSCIAGRFFTVLTTRRCPYSKYTAKYLVKVSNSSSMPQNWNLRPDNGFLSLKRHLQTMLNSTTFALSCPSHSIPGSTQQSFIYSGHQAMFTDRKKSKELSWN